MKKIVYSLFLSIAAGAVLFFGVLTDAHAESFKIATYNVENLFDLVRDKTDYPDYRVDGETGWNSAMLSKKLENIASVIKDLDADIVALQEVASRVALTRLQQTLARSGVPYEYAVIAEQASAPVKCALFSRFPVLGKREIAIGRASARHILKVTLDISGNPLIVYVNHWKSKSGPESKRVEYAARLAREISRLPCDADFILVGDFNADWDEYETFLDIDRLNDTGGVTGINHILRTLKDGRLVDETILTGQAGCTFLYNLWLEIPESQRWSVNFFGRKNSPDAIIVPKALYDGAGIAYVDNSFDKFDPDYLFEKNKVFRWQRADRGEGRHLGQGYSDHLPVFARFSTEPFVAGKASVPVVLKSAPMLSIADLYNAPDDVLPVAVENAVVIFRHQDSAVLKQKNGRAVYVYKSAQKLGLGMVCDLAVTGLKRYYGNLEVTGIAKVNIKGQAASLETYFISGKDIDFSEPEFRNEVIDRVTGIYENRWFHYGDDRKMRLYFTDGALIPENFSKITLNQVRIGYHKHPEIIVEKPAQIIVH